MKNESEVSQMPLLKVCCLTRSYDLAHTPVEPKVWKNSKKNTDRWS